MAVRKQFSNGYITETADTTYTIVNAGGANKDLTVNANSRQGPITVKMPGSVSGGYDINDVGGFAATNPITIDGNGATVNGFSTISLRTNGQRVHVSASGGVWVLTYLSAYMDPGGEISIAATDSNWSETLPNQMYKRVIYTGAITANRTVTYVRPGAAISGISQDYYERSIKNTTTGSFSLVVSVGSGGTVTVAPNTTQLCGFANSGVIAIGPAY